MKVYFYPPLYLNKSNQVDNPYSYNFIKSLDENFAVNINPEKHVALVSLLLSSFNSDVVILNWVDNIGHKKYSYIQYLVFKLTVSILRLRKVKIIWVFHNIHPHKGINHVTEKINKLMYKVSNIIITHSGEAKKYLEDKTDAKIFFWHHPLEKIKKHNEEKKSFTKDYDILIWGSIEPYKGVLEFLSYCNKNHKVAKNWKIKIIGLCKDKNYEKKLLLNLPDNVSFENKKVSFEELEKLIARSKYVLFPYVSSSVSSSGALMDTLALNGTIIGPAKGAFLDFSNENLCHIFNSFDDIQNLLRKEEYVSVDLIDSFIESNSWAHFGNTLSNVIKGEVKDER